MEIYEGLSADEILDRAEELIDKDETGEARLALDAVKEKNARYYFVESRYYQSKSWFNEQRKCLKKAVKAEPENERYKSALDELEKFRKSDEYKTVKKQMGGSNGFAEACCLCSCEACGTGLCEAIFNGCS